MADSTPPLDPVSDGSGVPPLDPLPGDTGADAALGLDAPLSRARSSGQRQKFGLAGVPGSEIETTAMLRDPTTGMPLYSDDDGATHELPSAASEAIRLAKSNVTSAPAEEARKALILARDMDLGPEIISGRVKEFEAIRKQDEATNKLAQLPSYTIQWFMSQSPAHAAALQKELDSWGALDWLFGKYTARQDASSAAARIINEGGPDVDKRLAALHNPVGPLDQVGSYERPTWYQAYGRAVYNLSTSVQSQYMKLYGPTKDTGKSVEEIKRQREWGMFPLPGESVYVPDGEGGTKRAAGQEKPIMRTANSLVGMAPVIVAATIHPALGAGLIYAETAGRSYEDLRLQGWEHKDAVYVSELTGFTSGAIAAATGGMFKFNFLPKATLGAMQGVSNGVIASIAKNPTFWRAGWGLGKNFMANTVMNMMMAGSEVSIKEAFDSARSGRPYNYSKVASATADASHAWAEMMALSVIPAYKEHLARKGAFHAVGERSQDEMDRARFVEQVYNNYEDRGRDLRSMYEASKIVTAAEALKDSDFMRDNPQDARQLIQMLVAPRESQTVYLKPEAVAKLEPSALDALGKPDISLGADKAKVPVNIVDLLMHPEGAALAMHAAGEPDLKSASELGGIDFTQPSEDVGPVTDEHLEAWLASERERRRQEQVAPTSRLPTVEEIHNAVQGALEQDTLAPRSAQGALPPTDYETGGRRRPAPDLGPRPRRAAPSTIAPPLPEPALRRWAMDAVSRLPTSALEGLADDYGRRAEEATREAFQAHRNATERAERSEHVDAEQFKHAADDAERRAQVSGALHKALRDGMNEIREHVDYFTKQASDEPLPGGGNTPREAAWKAGQEYGAAHDAVMQAIGLAKNRTHAAPDLSDIYDKLARLNRLPEDHFEGWDLKQSNDSISQKAIMPERSLEDLRLLKSVLTQLGSAADSENSTRVFGIRVAKAQMVEKIAERLKNLSDLPPGQRALADNERALSGAQEIGKERSGLAAELNRPSVLLLKIGEVGESMWFEGFVPGTARENAMWGDVAPVIREMDRNTPKHIVKMGREKIQYPNGEVHLRSDVWDMMLKLGTNDATPKIAKGMGFHDEVTGPANNPTVVTAEQKMWDWIHQNIADTPQNARHVMEKMVQPIWKLHENYLWPNIEKMFKEQGLAPPEKLSPAKVVIHGKEYEGGYGGRLKWLEARNKPVIQPGSFEALLDSDVSGPYTDQRHLAERDPDFSGKPVFSWDGVVSDMRKEIHDISMRPFLEDAHKVFSDPAIRELIANKMGKDALNQIYNPSGQSDWLHTVARGSVADVQSAKTWAKWLFKFQGLAAYSAFSLNTRVMLGQLSHIPAAMFGLGLEPNAITAGVTAAFNPDRRAWAHAASEVLRLRYSNYEERAIELTRQLTGLEPGRDAVRRATDHVNWMAWREMDAFLSHAIWESAYDNALRGLGDAATHEQAVRAADIAVTRMMPSQDIYDHSSFVRDRSVLGFSYMVRNFPNTLSNVAALNWWNARLQGRAATFTGAFGRAKVAAQFVGMVMAAEILGKGYTMQGGPREQDDQETWYRNRIFGAMAYPYMVSEPLVAGVEALSGNRHAARQEIDRMTPASMGLIAQVISDIGYWQQLGDDDRAYRAAAHLSGLLLKTPLTSAAYNLYNAAVNSEDPLDAAMKAAGYKR